MSNERIDVVPLQPPLGQLEDALIDEFIRAWGYDPANLASLPEEDL